MNTNLFTVFILTLTCSITYFYAEVREFYTPIKTYKSKIRNLKAKVKEERLSHMLTSFEFKEFRNHVATVLPEAIDLKGKGESSYPLRNLASVTQKIPNENAALLRAKTTMNEGKTYFRNKNYELAKDKFEIILNKHPYSAHVVEAMMLLVECHFVLGNDSQVIYFANKMLDVYPESELTGYAMIRLGKVYERQDRHSDAIEIYKTVILSFADRNLASVAQSSLRAVEL